MPLAFALFETMNNVTPVTNEIHLYLVSTVGADSKRHALVKTFQELLNTFPVRQNKENCHFNFSFANFV